MNNGISIILSLLICLLVSSTGQTLLSSGIDVSDYVTDLIETHEVVIFSKSYCPHCRATKDLFGRHREELLETLPNLEISIIELDLLSEPNDALVIQHHLYELTNQRTVPNIFVGTKHLGGNSNVQELDQSGILTDYIIELVQAYQRSLEL